MRISDWSSDVCSSDLYGPAGALVTIRPLKFSNNSPQAILTWKPSRDFMLYGAYKTGYLSGGYNINTQATPRPNPDTLIFGPEQVKGGEIGSKFWLFARRRKPSLVGYYDKYEGPQYATCNHLLLSYTVRNARAYKSK